MEPQLSEDPLASVLGLRAWPFQPSTGRSMCSSVIIQMDLISHKLAIVVRLQLRDIQLRPWQAATWPAAFLKFPRRLAIRDGESIGDVVCCVCTVCPCLCACSIHTPYYAVRVSTLTNDSCPLKRENFHLITMAKVSRNWDGSVDIRLPLTLSNGEAPITDPWEWWPGRRGLHRAR